MSDMASRAAGSAIGKVGASIIEKLAGKAADAIKDRLAQVDLWSEYERRYIDRYGKVKLALSGMREEVPLEQIYTGVRFLEGLSIGRFTSIEALEQGFRERPRQFRQQDCSPQDGMMVANSHPSLMVLGGPGAGKSTYLRRVGLESLRVKDSVFGHACIPVMLELKRFDGDSVDIKAAIAAEFSHVGFDFSAEFVEEALKQGRLLVLLDGLDEVPRANQDRVHQAIQDFVSRYNKKHQGNRFIASCRIAAFRSAFTGFTDIELADFADEQIQQFINNWFRSDLDVSGNTAEKCWSLLNDASYQSAKELAQTPLLLTFLCVVYDRTQSFPDNRASLYRKALDILLEEWAAEKRIRHEPIYEGLNTELEKVLLAEIAYQGFVNDRLFFTREELINHIQTFLEDSAERPKYLDGKAVLTAIAVQQGILVERAEDIYSFSHLTVQEYLTAQYLSQNQTALAEVIDQYLTDQRWREVLLLISGLLPNADNLLTQMKKTAQKKLCYLNLQCLLLWADQVTTGSTNQVIPSAKRVLAIFFAQTLATTPNITVRKFALTLALRLIHDCVQTHKFVLDLRFICALACDIDLDISRAHKLDFASIFNHDFANPTVLVQELEALKLQVDNKQLLKASPIFTQQLQQVWCNGLSINQELLHFARCEIQALEEYLYIFELIICCKESAVRVSRNVWGSIENAIAMPTLDAEL